MAVFMVTWHLHQDRPDYFQARANFMAALDRLDHFKMPTMRSVRWVSADCECRELLIYLRDHMHPADDIVVVRFDASLFAARVNYSLWDWMNERVPAPTREEADADDG